MEFMRDNTKHLFGMMPMLVFISVPPQPTVQSLVMYCDVPLSGGRPVVLNWTVSWWLIAYTCTQHVGNVILEGREGGGGGVSRRGDGNSGPDSSGNSTHAH